jgi:hypothetical protein
MKVPTDDFLITMAWCFLVTILVETAVLLVGLSRRHSVAVRLFAGIWLTSCTFPVVWLVLPPLFADRATYLLAAEIFAPVTECLLFWVAFLKGRSFDGLLVRDMIAIVAANLASFLVGEWIW